jgi:O-antigen/teichoic acid export membrane protein
MQFRASGRKLLSGSVLRIGNLVAAAIITFFLIPFIVHHLGDRLYGFWSVASGFIGYYGLLDLGLGTAVAQYVCVAIGRGDTSECRAIFNTALRIQSLMGGVALLATAALAVATPLFSKNPQDASLFCKVIVIMGVNAALAFPVKVYGGALEAELRFDIQSRLESFALLFRTVLLVWVILAGGGLLALAWASLLASLPVMVLQVWLARRGAQWARVDESSIDWKRAKALFSYSIYTFISMLGDTLRFSVDSVVVSAFVGLAAVTHYKIAGVFSRYFIGAISAVVGPFQPVLSRLHGASDESGLQKAFFFATKISTCISVLICFSLIAWGKPFIFRWMGAGYNDAYLPLMVLTLAVFLDVCQSPSIVLLNSTFRHRFYTYVNIIEGIVNLVLSLILARPLGILGVALGTLFGAFAVRFTLQPWWTCRASGIRFGTYMRFMGVNLFRCGSLMVAAIGLTAWGLRPNYGSLFASSICATVLYVVGSWLLVFNQGERRKFLGALMARQESASTGSTETEMSDLTVNR